MPRNPIGLLHGRLLLTVGDLASAEEAFLESLEAAERTGIVPEMLRTLVKIGEVFAAEEETKEAVELLASVISEPPSETQLFTDAVPISTMASTQLQELEREMNAPDCETAVSTGSSTDFRNKAKELTHTMSYEKRGD